MIKLTEEPEFVFYHNPLRGIDGNKNPEIGNEVTDCFRRLYREDAGSLKAEDEVYCARSIHDFKDGRDKGVVLHAIGLVKIKITEKRELFPGRFDLEYISQSIKDSGIPLAFDLESWKPYLYDSPHLEKINELVAKYGEGIILAPTNEDFRRQIRKERKIFGKK